MYNDPHQLTLDAAIEQEEALAIATKCEDCAADHRQLAEWLKELKVYKRYEECGYEMPKPRKLLRLATKIKGFGYACPWCSRGVIRTKGLQYCAVCGGMVDNDITEPAPEKMKVKSDKKPSWR